MRGAGPKAARRGLGDDDLQAAAREIEDGPVDARLGGVLIKKGSPRMWSLLTGMVAGCCSCTALPKSEKDNITSLEKKSLQMQAAYLHDVERGPVVEAG